MGPIRPPNEGQERSLLIRATRNCPWNRCQFCHTYKGQRFGYRSVEEIKEDLDAVKAISQEIKAASWRMGYGGRVTEEMVLPMIRGRPDIYSNGAALPEELTARIQTLANIAGWLSTGAKTVFLQDANSLVMRTPDLLQVLKYLKGAFPSVERVTSYARSKTAAKKSLAEMQDLCEAGLCRLHMGLESGCDEVLQEMQKGVTAEEQVAGGRKVTEAGMSLSLYVMPGLGGKRWSTKHAVETARVLNEIGPQFVRLRSLIVRRCSPLYDRMDTGDFETPTEDEVVDEIRLLVENLHCRTYLVSDQMSNLLWEVEGQIPEGKAAMLQIMDEYKAMEPPDRMRFRLERRAGSYSHVHGGIGKELQEKIREAREALQQSVPEAAAKVEDAIASLKQGFV